LPAGGRTHASRRGNARTDKLDGLVSLWKQAFRDDDSIDYKRWQDRGTLILDPEQQADRNR
jgi:hypothetical protein